MDLSSLGAWYPLLEDEINKPYFTALMNKVSSAYEKGDPLIFPPQEDLFTAFQLNKSINKIICIKRLKIIYTFTYTDS